jgi:hypothetical protein
MVHDCWLAAGEPAKALAALKAAAAAEVGAARRGAAVAAALGKLGAEARAEYFAGLRMAGLAEGAHYDALQRARGACAVLWEAPAPSEPAELLWLGRRARLQGDERAWAWLLRRATRAQELESLWAELREIGVRPQQACHAAAHDTWLRLGQPAAAAAALEGMQRAAEPGCPAAAKLATASLVRLGSTAGDAADAARHTYLAALRAGGLANARHYAVMLRHARGSDEASVLLEQMAADGFAPGPPAYLAVHAAWLDLGDPGAAAAVLGQAALAGIDVAAAATVALVRMLGALSGPPAAGATAVRAVHPKGNIHRVGPKFAS